MEGESKVGGSREKWVSRWQMLIDSNLKELQKHGTGFVKIIKGKFRKKVKVQNLCKSVLFSRTVVIQKSIVFLLKKYRINNIVSHTLPF